MEEVACGNYTFVINTVALRYRGLERAGTSRYRLFSLFLIAAGQEVTCYLKWRVRVLSYSTLHPNIAPPPHNLHLSSSRQEIPGWWGHWHIAPICHKYSIGYTPGEGKEGRDWEVHLFYLTIQLLRIWQREIRSLPVWGMEVSSCLI